MISSAAAGASLIAASVVLVIAVSAIIGVRGFHSARKDPAAQSVTLRSGEASSREAGATATETPAPVVIGGAERAGSRRTAARPPARAARRGQARSRAAAPRRPAITRRAAAPSRPRPSRPAAPTTGRPAAPAEAPDAVPVPAVPKPAPVDPVKKVVEDVTGAVETVTKKPVESVGDVLLDLRDVLP